MVILATVSFAFEHLDSYSECLFHQECGPDVTKGAQKAATTQTVLALTGSVYREANAVENALKSAYWLNGFLMQLTFMLILVHSGFIWILEIVWLILNKIYSLVFWIFAVAIILLSVLAWPLRLFIS